jgi:hypothetical protein
MMSSNQPNDELKALLERAWSTLGLPFAGPPIQEKRHGIIDLEALIAVTLLHGPEARFETDVPAWLRTFEGLVHHQKLKSMVRRMPPKHREALQDHARRSTAFRGAPGAVRQALGIETGGTTERVERALKGRQAKIAGPDQVASDSLMVFHRLLFGTGFRADVVALTHVKGLAGKGGRLAELLCTHASTVSRILRDLRACGFLDGDNERTQAFEAFPGFFLSTRSLWNLCEILDAEPFRSDRHREETLKGLDCKHDEVGRRLIRGNKDLEPVALSSCIRNA